MEEQIPLALPVLTDFGQEAFLVADSNRQAVAWVDRWPDWPDRRLLLLGPRGSGKSHLGRIWAGRAGALVVPAAGLGEEDPLELAARGGAWLVEDLQDLADEAAFLHLVNALQQRQGYLLLTARQAPARLGLCLADLHSRLATFMPAPLGVPEEALLAGVLRKLFADRQVRVPERVLHYLLPRMSRSLGDADKLVEALDRAALARGGAITLALAREVLQAEPLGEGDTAAATAETAEAKA